MKINGKVELKEDITMVDIGNIVETIAEFIIRRTDDDEIIYTPYYKDQGSIYAVTAYLVKGIELEDEETAMDVYENDPVVKKLVDKFIATSAEFGTIEEQLFDVIEFRKEYYIRSSEAMRKELIKVLEKERALNDALLETARQQRVLLERQIEESKKNEELMSTLSPDELTSLTKRLADGTLDSKQMVDAVADKFIASQSLDEKTAKLLDEKSEKIKELEKTEKLLTEKNEQIKELKKYKALYEGRNVVADFVDDGK